MQNLTQQELRRQGLIVCEGSAACFDCLSETIAGRRGRTGRWPGGAGERMKARYSVLKMENLLGWFWFLACEHWWMRKWPLVFLEYNRRCPEHRMEALARAHYVLAVR